ncbi:glutaredoxin 5 [Arctopsyche grandis]|uniref:glutaredoxin 5 n=1 Tax=Arctopsyche grandis TaxID=121162 RepID=UPI00406D6C92
MSVLASLRCVARRGLWSAASTGTTRCFSSDASSPDVGALVRAAPVVVFMKGEPAAPRCGFSNAVVQVFRLHDVKYDSHDVLKDENLRQGIKDFSNWPTIPQVFINGEFVGGCDIMLQLHQSGELIEELKKAGITSALLKKDNEKKEE